MKRINLLDIKTTNKIAAGEVIERPASVVKELVENSIDSEARDITIEILEGGQKFIRVVDDGTGIHPDDVKKAFMPHSTSKIKLIDDIFKINTMGFRGEALASIASVSKVKLKSRIDNMDCGKEINISGGKIDYFQDTACNTGTAVEVSDLFFNVPARQKFLKSQSRETAYISDIISRLALANSTISFKFFNNGKKSTATFGTGKLIDTIRAIYGKNIYENIIPIEKHGDIASVYGYIGNSEISRGSRNNQSIFVNRRYVKDKSITTAVERAFKSFLTINKFPFFIIFLDIFPEYVDVNVHPSKSEIKFSDSRTIFKFIFDAVHETLRNSLKNSFTIDDVDAEEDIESCRFDHNDNKNIVQLPIDLKSPESVAYNIMDYGNQNIKEASYDNNNNNDTPKVDDSSVSSMEKSELEKNDISLNPDPKFPKLRIIGQFNNTYIIGEAFNIMYLIDQHAAHEKILFEKYKKDMIHGTVISQLLISPVIIELTAYDYSTYTENSELFKRAGFQIELFGGNAVSIREVPVILGNPDVKNLFVDMLENIKNMGSGETWEVKYHLIATMACKAAIKAHDNLSQAEMENLVESLRFIDDPFNCPHGRPTIIKITTTDLEKKFKRIQ
ncbi:MAG: DNA mismatch repair endonuclease MutL [Clostridium sp.]|jgi:DNA mismatch repair protein MutL|uniref:DNA mismatch repair endonuclease MutL n=1 Tax=Clostridium sp. TaxID=1506 RepID=UPI0025BAF987|nr:DNA mismatch repair endonuclease MutL [Clostridium sp.]MCH3963835.1 DNA mismatch repair endonuclease MutL [Clostridium sp.]MCI1716954.1 DNA mismatch repair endonuclease MutL [Clostridium sp.]MCI1801327.1 DNA mismatch repair endonuclease MutL [Clostridium sp.]MCI1815173.1 DNA mismatch repair endonuclease MutL [Clostridium sp.]MCI1872043.1 DNA mismatch repair endonuclease MutL [Clostridium sp.]